LTGRAEMVIAETRRNDFMRRVRVLLALSIAALAASAGAAPAPSTAASVPVPSAAAIRTVHVERASGGGVMVLVDATIAAPAAAVAQVVGEVDAWPSWIPRMTAVRPINPAGDSTGDSAGGATRAHATGTQVFETDVDLPWPLSDV